MVLRTIFSLLGVILFLFFFWRKLKDDYTPNQIFTSGIYSLLGILAFSLFANYYFPKLTFWASFVGSLLGLIAGVNKYKFRFFESLEAWISGNLGILFSLYLYESVKKFRLFEAYSALTIAFLIFLFLFLDKHYKKFRWYRSGRVGFSGFIIAGVYFLIRSLIALLFPDMLFFVGKIDVILSAVLAFFSFVTVYNLARIEK